MSDNKEKEKKIFACKTTKKNTHLLKAPLKKVKWN